jgi:hypothetical protein
LKIIRQRNAPAVGVVVAFPRRAKRDTMQKAVQQIDRTKNMSGPKNRPPLLPLSRCANQILIDEFVADGWIATEDRDREVIALYQGQAAAKNRSQFDQNERRDQADYSAKWINRWLDAW